MSEETLQYPTKIAKEIGLSKNRINALKRQGCPFVGRKTSVRIVRAFLYQMTGAESLLEPSARPQHSGGNTLDAQAGLSGLQGASLLTQKGLHDGNE